MKRTITIIALSLGAVAGLGLAIYRFHGPFPHRREAFERRVADVCTQSALRVYEQRSEKPGR